MAVNFRGRLANLSEVGSISDRAWLVAHVCLWLYVVLCIVLLSVCMVFCSVSVFACVWNLSRRG